MHSEQINPIKIVRCANLLYTVKACIFADDCSTLTDTSTPTCASAPGCSWSDPTCTGECDIQCMSLIQSRLWWHDKVNLILTCWFTVIHCYYLSKQYNICTTSAQRLWFWSNIVQMLYKCSVFAGTLHCYVEQLQATVSSVFFEFIYNDSIPRFIFLL